MRADTDTQGDRAYAYDKAGRLTEARDTPAGQGCTIRTYGYDADSNRTSLQARAPGAGGACDPAATPTTKSSSYDAADRLITAGTGYDAFGRTTATPGQDAGGSALAAAYYVNDLAASAGQGAETRQWALDPLRRVRTETAAGAQAADRTLHYDTDADTPSWTAETADGLHWTRNITGPAGDLAAIQDSQTGTRLQLASLHGDIAATASPDPNATGLTATLRSGEFGNPQAGPAARYQWLGAKQRQNALPGGVILMGARLYNPNAGRFLQTDPVPGGSANDYDYTFQDPINATDLDGRCPVCIVVAAISLRLAIAWSARRAAVVAIGKGAIRLAGRMEARAARVEAGAARTMGRNRDSLARYIERHGGDVTKRVGRTRVRWGIHDHAGGPHAGPHIQANAYRVGRAFAGIKSEARSFW